MRVIKFLARFVAAFALLWVLTWFITIVFVMFLEQPILITLMLLIALMATVFYGPIRDEIRRKKEEKK
jgi:fatty acid desaturase